MAPVPGPRAGFTRPNPARVYQYLIGGADYLPADRELAERLCGIHPGLRSLARAARQFVIRAVTWMTGEGIAQFIDAGCGLPVSPAVHEVAREGRPGARVAYIDRDPYVLSHARALLGGEGTAVIAADVSGPERILDGPGLAEVIDLSQPCGVLFGGVLGSMSPSVARGAVAGFARALAPGSAVAISCASYADPALAARVARAFAGGTGAAWRSHDRETIEGFFAAGRLRPAHGRVMDVGNWLDCPGAEQPGSGGAVVLGGVGLKD